MSKANLIPNYPMLRLMIIESVFIQKKYPELEHMPRGAICPGYDIKLIPALAVLKYLYGVKTQWSCQGNHKDGITTAYILLAPDHELPESLTKALLNAKLKIYPVPDYNEKVEPTGKTRIKISPITKDDYPSVEDLKDLNTRFMEVLTNWASQQIKSHLPNMTAPYYSDLVGLYVN